MAPLSRSDVSLQQVINVNALSLIRQCEAGLREFLEKRTYSSAADWKNRANDMMALLEVAKKSSRQEAVRALHEADRLRSARMKRSILWRWLLSTRAEVHRRHAAALSTSILGRLENMETRLAECINVVPRNDLERRALIDKLKLDRKSLRLDKRDVNARKRDIHRSAKEASARVEASAGERREIRQDRYDSLSPFENQAEKIDLRLRSVDRQILWLEHLAHHRG